MNMRDRQGPRGWVRAAAAGVVALLLLGCAPSASPPNLASAPAAPLETPGAQSRDAFVAAMPSPAPEAAGATDESNELPPPPGRYTLGPGDVITVTVWGHPELSGKHVIGPDGDIQLPFVGSVRISDLSADDAGAKLTQALREIYVLSVASLTIDSYNGNQILVLGNVAHPGAQRFSEQPTLLAALAKAGAGAGGDKDGLGGMATRCAIIRGRDRLLWVDLRPLLRGQDASLNIALERNDLVYVPDADAEIIYVMGEVKSPGAYPLTAHMSFLEALTRAGGTTESAQTGKVVLERPVQKQQEVIDLQQMVEKGQANYQLEAGDIVYVPKSGLAKFGYVLQQINPITTLAFLGAAF
ncbi:MAG TPA: polysaccharide biosynthesis/export family protein [Candidatus Binataceae bacterium]|nr:polysaccharide biosynthesis/export family protein [Candidatus Binataceae bacterium]